MISGLVRQWPISAVLGGIALALAFVALDRFRVGSVLLAASVVAAFILRLVLTDEQAGLLAVRARPVDLGVLGGLATMLTIMALWVPPPA